MLHTDVLVVHLDGFQFRFEIKDVILCILEILVQGIIVFLAFLNILK